MYNVAITNKFIIIHKIRVKNHNRPKVPDIKRTADVMQMWIYLLLSWNNYDKTCSKKKTTTAYRDVKLGYYSDNTHLMWF